FGLEFRAFANRLYADFSYYDISSKDLIFDVPLDPGSGYSNFRTNVGGITNKGFEALVGGIPFQPQNFSWETSFNIPKNENKWEERVDDKVVFFLKTAKKSAVNTGARVGAGCGNMDTTTSLRNDAG